MQRYKKMLAVAVVAAASSQAMAQTTYNIQRIGLTDAGNAPGLYVGVDSSAKTIEQNGLYYADSSGNVVGSTSQFNGTSSPTYSAIWYYNSSSNVTTQIGLTSVNGTQYVKPAAAGASIAGQVNTSVYSSGYSATRVYNNGYVAGTSGRYDASGNSMGPDAWLFNGTTTTRIGLPTLATGGSNATYSPNLSYSYVNPVTTSSTYGDTIQAMGGPFSGTTVLPGGNGTATGVASVYYANTTTSPTTYTAIGSFGDGDAWYFNGTNTIQIGLIGGNNVNVAGTNGLAANANTPFERASIPIEISSSGVVFGYSKYYGGSTSLNTANGQDLWIYDPNNATGAGANGTIMVAPTSAPAGDVYAGGNSALTAPTYFNNNGQFAAAFQLFGSTDTARATALGQDTFIGTYSGGSVSFTQIGLTATVNPIYTFYQNTGSVTNTRTGVGGSNIGTGPGFSYLTQYPAVSSVGNVVGYTKRTAASGSTGVLLGQDTWVYYAPGHVPSGGAAGTTQIGLTGGVYSATTATGVTQASGAAALSTSGAVAGYSQRYASSTSTTTNGQDAWYYDPAHGITSAVQVGLSSPNAVLTGSGQTASSYSYTPASAANTYSSSTITALNNTGMVGGTTLRNPATGSFNSLGGINSGADAWVYSASTHTTYLVDTNASNASITSPNYVYSTISFITDAGVAFGYDYSQANQGSGPASEDTLFDWYLAYDSGDGLYDTPTFQYLGTAVNAASFTAGNWEQLDTASSVSGYSSVTPSGSLVGLGSLSTDNGSSYVPFVLTPGSVPEPASLSLLGLGGLALLGRRRRTA